MATGNNENIIVVYLQSSKFLDPLGIEVAISFALLCGIRKLDSDINSLSVSELNSAMPGLEYPMSELFQLASAVVLHLSASDAGSDLTSSCMPTCHKYCTLMLFDYESQISGQE